MGSTRLEIEFFCVVESRDRPWHARACLENIDELGKDADDGNKRGELHANQPSKFAIDISEFSINFSESAIYVRA
jgi:hypothetical protein